jgi:hypothetical protein
VQFRQSLVFLLAPLPLPPPLLDREPDAAAKFVSYRGDLAFGAILLPGNLCHPRVEPRLFSRLRRGIGRLLLQDERDGAFYVHVLIVSRGAGV